MKRNLSEALAKGTPRSRTIHLLPFGLWRRFERGFHSARSGIFAWRSRHLMRQKVMAVAKVGKDLKIIVGASSTEYDGWLSTDLPTLDALNPRHWRSIFPCGSIFRILAEHVIEHWSENDFRVFLKTVRPFLAEGGLIRIAVPDGFHPDPHYIEYVKPGGTGIGADDHKVLYNHVSISRVLSEERYSYNLLEYFDESGNFHRSPWNDADGFVVRSADFDSRNKKYPLSYTSLIIDAWQARGCDSYLKIA